MEYVERCREEVEGWRLVVDEWEEEEEGVEVEGWGSH